MADNDRCMYCSEISFDEEQMGIQQEFLSSSTIDFGVLGTVFLDMSITQSRCEIGGNFYPHISISVSGDGRFLGDLTSRNPLHTRIHYCPMCGRKLD